MGNRTNDQIYEKIVEVKAILVSKQSECVTKAYFDTSIKGLSKGASEEKKKEEEKPGLVEQLAPLTGVGDIIANIAKNAWLPGIVAAVSVIGIKFFNWDVLGKKLLDKMKLAPDSEKFVGIKRKPAAAGQVPVSQVDVDRLKSMRSAALSLTRSLSDLHKEVQRAAAQVA